MLAEDVNSKLPDGMTPDLLAHMLRETFRAIRAAYGGRTWPTSKVIMTAAGQVVQKSSERKAIAKAEAKSPEQINADRIKNGDAVGEYWVYGRGAQSLLAMGLVEMSDLRRLRSGLFFAAKDAWGADVARAKEAEWIARDELAASELARAGMAGKAA